MFNMIQYVVSGALTMWDASNGAFWMILIGSSFWLVDAEAMTLAFLSLANWIRDVPTPDADAWTNTVSPSFKDATLNLIEIGLDIRWN